MADGLERFCMRPRKRCSNRHYRSPVPLAAQYGGSRKASELWSGIRRRAGPAVTQLTEPPLYRRQRRNANLVRNKLRFPSVGRGRQRRADAGVVTGAFAQRPAWSDPSRPYILRESRALLLGANLLGWCHKSRRDVRERSRPLHLTSPTCAEAGLNVWDGPLADIQSSLVPERMSLNRGAQLWRPCRG